MGSGTVQLGWDLLTGEQFLGEDVPNTIPEIARNPDDFEQWLLGSFVPFALEELPAAGRLMAEGVRERDPGTFGAGAALVVGEQAGLTSLPLSFSDVRTRWRGSSSASHSRS